MCIFGGCLYIKEQRDLSPIYVILNILFILACIALISVILLQKKSSQLGSSVAGMGNTETYADKNRSQTHEGKLELYTKAGGVILFVFSIVLCLIR
jgi:protein translocase SecG subunit